MVKFTNGFRAARKISDEPLIFFIGCLYIIKLSKNNKTHITKTKGGMVSEKLKKPPNQTRLSKMPGATKNSF